MVAKISQKQKEPWWQILVSLLIGAVLLGVVFFLIFSNFRIGQKREDMVKRIEELQREVSALEQKNEELRQGISDAETETFWEGKAREQGYQKPGEETVVVVLPEEAATSVPEEKGFFAKFLEKIGF